MDMLASLLFPRLSLYQSRCTNPLSPAELTPPLPRRADDSPLPCCTDPLPPPPPAAGGDGNARVPPARPPGDGRGGRPARLPPVEAQLAPHLARAALPAQGLLQDRDGAALQPGGGRHVSHVGCVEESHGLRPLLTFTVKTSYNGRKVATFSSRPKAPINKQKDIIQDTGHTGQNSSDSLRLAE